MIYLDAHATTPCDPAVIEAMLPTFSDEFGNASSRHHLFGVRARRLVEESRVAVAELIGAEPREIIFTSGATESDNLAIKGVARAAARRGRHIVTTRIEHKAVLDPCERLESEGFRVTYVPVSAEGLVDPAAIEEAIELDTVLVSVILASNEIGTVQPIAAIGELCRQRGILLHTDAVQGLAWLDVDVEAFRADLLSISAHKIYGPKGAGALYVRRRRPHVRLRAELEGGGHERGLRSGTLNVPGIVGLGKACALTRTRRAADSVRVAVLRDLLLERLRQGLPDGVVNGSLRHRLPNNLSLTVPGVEAERLVTSVREVALSSGAACSSPGRDGSYVLRALGDEEAATLGAARFGLSRLTTREEVEEAARRVIEAARAIRGAGGGDEPGDECGSGSTPSTARDA